MKSPVTMDNYKKALADLFQHDPAVQALLQKKKGIGGLSPYEEALVLFGAFEKEKKNMVVVKPSLYQAQLLYQYIKDLGSNAILFAVEESLQVEAIAASPEMEANRIESLARFLKDEEPAIVITHLAGLVRYLPDPKLFEEKSFEVEVGMKLDYEELKERLRQLGYRQVDRVETPLSYAYRGEVVDLFSVNWNEPLRIEFFDDEVESLRFFDASTQMTTTTTKKETIIPATDYLWSKEEKEEIYSKALEKLEVDCKKLSEEESLELRAQVDMDLDYIEKGIKENRLYRYFPYTSTSYNLLDYIQDPFIITSSNEKIENTRKTLMEEQVRYVQGLYEKRRGLLTFQVYQDYYDVLKKKDVYDIKNVPSFDQGIQTTIQPLDFPKLNLGMQLREIERLGREKVVIIQLSGANVKTVTDGLNGNGTKYTVLTGKFPKKEGVYLWIQDGVEGYTFENYVFITERELFQIKIKHGKYTNKFRHAQVLNDYEDLAPGDYVVHNEYGIGRYVGLVTKKLDGNHHDYLNIAYRGDDVLLVPLEQFKLVRKFIGSEGAVPRLSKLGTSEWKKTKESLKANVEEIAENLLELYTEREKNIGFAFSKDSPLQVEFENSFEYELTNDQDLTLHEIKADMEGKKPMDRLVCGDVGFGKTELAVRAAFKAVLDHKQVAVLCPTTILSRQHYLTFVERMKDYGINVELVNRFVDASKQKDILARLKEGNVDILIGTHRVLSQDIVFKDLGLLVVDEEQRFGVEAKEKIKQLKRTIDVLSLSATPIPRTLQMSLIGIRSLSQLNTPPIDRMPVQTYVIERDENLVKEVIERELARGGQVFYLYNRVDQIYAKAREIEKLVPGASVGVVHGKMDKDYVEDVMVRFTDGEYQILICTTIIENGIDIPNANTMIVERADLLGLAQLYQIKGRVGRSNRIAYAYLMVEPNMSITETASKRLQTIKDFTQLGSGYKIAMRDLSIRGAGDLLGAKQAGFINTVGMDLYVEMLQDAILEKKGIEKRETQEIVPRIKIGVDGYIPKEFEDKDYEKIHLYQRIDQATKENELQKLEEEVNDRYGKIPGYVQILFEKRRMEILTNNEKVEEVREMGQNLEVVLDKDYCDNVDGVKLFEVVSKLSLDINMKYKRGRIILSIPKKGQYLQLGNEMVEKINRL